MEDALNIGGTFLKQLDEYIKANWESITCDYIFKLYQRFFEDLKELKGNANGFTGLSEYLIFRFLYHQLNDSFTPEKYTQEIKYFVGKHYKIGQSINMIPIGQPKCYPDISLIQKDTDKLLAVLQIKTFLTEGKAEIEKEMMNFSKLKEHCNPALIGVLIIYAQPSNGPLFKELENIKNANNWFNYIILKNNNGLLCERLHTALKI